MVGQITEKEKIFLDIVARRKRLREYYAAIKKNQGIAKIYHEILDAADDSKKPAKKEDE